ncbi:MAG: hypothetical protein ACD_20C00317G0037 [uncultured bacterium]|nr:MAG: hypothetical protein ACD_20C00317G0037 [uncultured bacterium]
MLVKKINPNTILSKEAKKVNAVRPQSEHKVAFEGYRSNIDAVSLINADKYARDSFIKASESLGNDYVQGERSILPFLMDTIRRTVNAMSSHKLSAEARKVREGLDIIA